MKSFKKIKLNKEETKEIEEYRNSLKNKKISKLYKDLSELLKKIKRVNTTFESDFRSKVISQIKSHLLIIELYQKINSNADKSYFLA